MTSLRVALRGACVKKQPHVVGAPLFCYYAKAVRMTEAGVVELADTLDLGSSAKACRFDSCCPHHFEW